MEWVEALGYVASGMVFVTFWMKTMIPLRFIAIGSNVLFFSYGIWGGLLPITILHGLLFPLNSLRLYQGLVLRRRIREMANADFDVQSLIPFMTEIKYSKGDTLFKKGDRADVIYYLSEGKAEISELGLEIGVGELIGEIGLFSANKERTQTVNIVEDSVLMGIGEEKVLQIYSENPEFGIYVTKMIVERLLANLGSGVKQR